jgi:hypothetical protein
MISSIVVVIGDVVCVRQPIQVRVQAVHPEPLIDRKPQFELPQRQGGVELGSLAFPDYGRAVDLTRRKPL